MLTLTSTNTSLPRRTGLNTAITLVTLFLGATVAFSQDRDMDCRPILSIPPQCAQIAKNLSIREAYYRDKIEVLKDELHEAPPSQRKNLSDQIKALETQRNNDAQLAQLKAQLASCRAKYDPTPRRPLAPSELDGSFIGSATVVTDNPNVNPTPIDL